VRWGLCWLERKRSYGNRRNRRGRVGAYKGAYSGADIWNKKHNTGENNASTEKNKQTAHKNSVESNGSAGGIIARRPL
jgi:hypothetical protein